ncbi:flavin reductase family protein [Variovorax paradoxus]|uniref:Flavin reductase n=1 Tax=Variovorax paradoxus TaxID=34073 RepID=A0A6I6HIJ4_VARPD|nr:flavin reductase family protein [Variovorax paradoxus]QGW80987.1 flavin reductase [Variovorax paradoxus]
MYSWALITGDAAETVDARQLRQALGAFPTGVCLVTTTTPEGKREGMTINSFASVSLDPPLILWSIRDDTRSAEAFLAARPFNLSVLTASQRDLAWHFAKPAADKFERFAEAFELAPNGCARLVESVATFECSTYSRHQEGDHTIILGRVDRFSRTDTPPLLFHSGQMGSLWELAENLERPQRNDAAPSTSGCRPGTNT